MLPLSTRTMVRNEPRGRPEQHALAAYLVEAVGQAILTHRDLAMPGILGLCKRTGSLTFAPDRDVAHKPLQPCAGDAVRVDFLRCGSWAWLEGEVRDSDRLGRWRLGPPRVVVLDSRRLVPRMRPGSDDSFQFRPRGRRRGLAGRFPVEDISVAGLGFLHWPHLDHVEPGQRIDGRLSLPGGLQLAVGLEVKDSRPLRTEGMRWVAGARFVGMSLEERLEVAMTLNIWERRRRLTELRSQLVAK